jgi:glyoxylase-like metal-dependent hydrolase (beta-lactamase superfamily II)
VGRATRGRHVREVDFSSSSALRISDFKAVDFFGDGSFYLLDTPGHAVGHVCGLARTTCSKDTDTDADKDTFIFMGGDICHHGGELRPSTYVPLPQELFSGLSSVHHPLTRVLQPPCPGAAFEAMQTQRGRAPDEPFFDPAVGLDIPLAIESIKKAQQADADDRVLFIYAHDATVYGVADLFPLPANAWQKLGWRDKMFWAFLADFEAAYKQQQQQQQ